MAADTVARALALSAKADIADIKVKSGIAKKVVSSVEEVVEENTLYFVPNPTPAAKDNYDEYMLINGVAEKIGATTEIDLSEYTKTEDMASVALSGAYEDLTGSPVNVSDFTNDAGYAAINDESEAADKVWSALKVKGIEERVAALEAIPNAEDGEY